MRRFLLAAILASSVLNGAAADERLRNNPIVGDAVPPPEELAPPSADIPPGIAAWYGRWSGLWDGKWPVVVAITGIRESGDGYVATGRYYWRETLTERYRTREGAPWEVPVPSTKSRSRVSRCSATTPRPEPPAPSAPSRRPGPPG